MTEKSASSRSGWIILSLILVAGLGALSGWLLGTRHAAAPSKAAIEEVVRSYILEHPEHLPAARERLQARERGNGTPTPGVGLKGIRPRPAPW